MGQINKGAIASIEGNTARVVPSDAGAKPTAKITIPWHLRGDTGRSTNCIKTFVWGDRNRSHTLF